MNNFKGIYPAIASPCDEKGVFLEGTYVLLAETLASTGIDGLYVCGATGDGINMKVVERKRAIEIAVEVANRYNQKVIAHVGAKNVKEALSLSIYAAQVGADAVSSMPPMGASLEQLVCYYKEIADACGIDVIVYHFPAYTKTNLSFNGLLSLLDIEGVVGLKYTDWDLCLMKRLKMARPDIVIFNGYDEILVPGLMYGADGGIGSNYNLFPKLFIAIYRMVRSGEVGKAMELQNLFMSYTDLLHKAGICELFEYLMRQNGFGPRCFRESQMKVDVELIKEIKPKLYQIIDTIKNIS